MLLNFCCRVSDNTCKGLGMSFVMRSASITSLLCRYLEFVFRIDSCLVTAAVTCMPNSTTEPAACFTFKHWSEL